MKVAFALYSEIYTEDQNYLLQTQPRWVEWPGQLLPQPGQFIEVHAILEDKMPNYYDDYISFKVESIWWSRIDGEVMPVIKCNGT